MSTGRKEIAIRSRGGRHALPAAAVQCIAVAAGVLLLGLESGGYYATTWSIATVGALTVGACTAIHAHGVRTDLVLVLLALFVAWVVIETLRPGAATRAVPELERDVLYLAVMFAALQLVTRRTAAAALAGVLAAICALLLIGLYDILRPFHIAADAYEGRLLFQPLGYANACGALAAIGLVVGLGFASRGKTAAAAALVPLAVALALTQSRGAALALAFGLGVTTFLDPERGRFLGAGVVLLPLPAAVTVFATRSHVTDAGASSAVVARACITVAALVIVATPVQLVVARRARVCIAIGNRAARSLAAVALLGALVAAALGSGDRIAYWRVAWHDALVHPLLGSAPGTFGREWLQHSTIPTGALNAHSLYLETLAETGPLALLMLLAALAVPLVAVARRRSPLGAAAAGGYAAFLAHAAVDWDWQMPAVTVAGLICAVCALRARTAGEAVSRRRLPAVLVAAATIALGAAAADVGNNALAAAARDAQAGALADAAHDARLAAAWQPWSAEPRRLLGEVELASGDRADARRLFAQALRRDPRDIAAVSDLARAASTNAGADEAGSP